MMTAKDWMTSAMCQSWKRWKVVSRIGLDAEQRVKSGRGDQVVTRMGLDDHISYHTCSYLLLLAASSF